MPQCSTVGLPSSLGLEPVCRSWRASRYAANGETDLLIQSGTHVIRLFPVVHLSNVSQKDPETA
jgi:hypothetical protein